MSIAYSYPLLAEITKAYISSKKSYSDVYVLACQHLLEPQKKMFELLVEFGIPKDSIKIFGKIYSTSNEIVNEMKNEGFNVSLPVFDPAIPFDIEHARNCKNELEAFSSKCKSFSKIIILDDGGQLLKTVNDSLETLPDSMQFIGIEQTSSGFRKLEDVDLKFPVYNVARSAVKLIKESPIIADIGCSRIFDVVEQYSISEPRVLVVGLGPLGSSTLLLLKEKGYFAVGYDIAHHDKAQLIDLIKNNKINIVVGATGTNILDEEQLRQINQSLASHLYLISMSSSDREFPTSYFRKNAAKTINIHSDIIWNNTTLINNGFPLTFKGNRYESTPEEIERTIGLLYGSALEALSIGIKGKGFIDVPEKITSLL